MSGVKPLFRVWSDDLDLPFHEAQGIRAESHAEAAEYLAKMSGVTNNIGVYVLDENSFFVEFSIRVEITKKFRAERKRRWWKNEKLYTDEQGPSNLLRPEGKNRSEETDENCNITY